MLFNSRLLQRDRDARNHYDHGANDLLNQLLDDHNDDTRTGGGSVLCLNSYELREALAIGLLPKNFLANIDHDPSPLIYMDINVRRFIRVQGLLFTLGLLAICIYYF